MGNYITTFESTKGILNFEWTDEGLIIRSRREGREINNSELYEIVDFLCQEVGRLRESIEDLKEEALTRRWEEMKPKPFWPQIFKNRSKG